MLVRDYIPNLVQFAQTEKSRAILAQDNVPSEHDILVAGGVTCLRFLSSTIIFLDIISSVTTGVTPHLLPHYPQLLAPASPIRLEDVTGCENWVMLQIGYIAALHETKNRAFNAGGFCRAEFQRTADDIGREIESRLTTNTDDSVAMKLSDPALRLKKEVQSLVTRIFALMAQVYLHLVCHGFQQLAPLASTITDTRAILQNGTSKKLLPAMVAPLFVFASVAAQGDEQEFFRGIFSGPRLLDPFTGQRGKLLPILEVIWMRRQTGPDFEWKDCVELTRDTLLI